MVKMLRVSMILVAVSIPLREAGTLRIYMTAGRVSSVKPEDFEAVTY